MQIPGLSNQVRGKAIELYRTCSFFDPLVSFLPFVCFVSFVSFVVKSECFLCFSFFIVADISGDISVVP